MLAVQLSVQAPREAGPVRDGVDVKQAPAPRTRGEHAACLQEATAAIAWPCTGGRAAAQLCGLACAFGVSLPASTPALPAQR